MTGSGTNGQLTKWAGADLIEDPIITQDTAGRIGVGTATPTSKLTVAGAIESRQGGVKFPDGTIQTTAAVSGLTSVAHDATLTGAGTAASPLSVAPNDPAQHPFTSVLTSPGHASFTVPAGGAPSY